MTDSSTMPHMEYLLPVVILIIVMMGFGLCAPYRVRGSAEKMPRWAQFVPLLVLIALFRWLWAFLYFFIWAFILGDNGEWPYTVLAAGLLSLSYAAFLYFRISTHRISRLNVLLHVWISVILLVLLVCVYTADFVGGIGGTSPESTVQSYIKHWNFPDVQLVPQPPNPDFIEGCKSYLVMSGPTLRGKTTVCPYKKFWWHVGSWEGIAKP
mgnify:CR=1 FL=1